MTKKELLIELGKYPDNAKITVFDIVSWKQEEEEEVSYDEEENKITIYTVAD